MKGYGTTGRLFGLSRQTAGSSLKSEFVLSSLYSLVVPSCILSLSSCHLYVVPLYVSSLLSFRRQIFSSIKLYTIFSPQSGGEKIKLKKYHLLRSSRGQQSCSEEANPLRRPSDLLQRLLESLAVGFVAANHRLPLLVLLLVEDPQEVTQLRDGERVPLRRPAKIKALCLFWMRSAGVEKLWPFVSSNDDGKNNRRQRGGQRHLYHSVISRLWRRSQRGKESRTRDS